MEGRTQNDDLSLVVVDETFNFDLDWTSSTWNDLSLDPPYDANDAAPADVYLGADAHAIDTSSLLDPLTCPNQLNFYNLAEPLTLGGTYTDNVSTNWDYVMMSMSTPTDPSTTTFNASSHSNGRTDYSTNYTASPASTSTTQSPRVPLPSRMSVTLPETPREQSSSAKSSQGRRTKMKPGTRPCDTKRQQRKIDRPERCHICKKGHQWRRDLDRHYRSTHPDEAAKMGLDKPKPKCEHCGEEPMAFDRFPKRKESSRLLFLPFLVNTSPCSLAAAAAAAAAAAPITMEDFYEPSRIKVPALLNSTSHEPMMVDQEPPQPPEGYYATDCPNDAENNTLTCPYINCDGFIFASAEDKFAAASALERHERGSRHKIQWLCRDEECEMMGAVFATYEHYASHVQESDGHFAEKSDQDDLDPEDSAFTPSDSLEHLSIDDDDDDDVFDPSLQDGATDLNTRASTNSLRTWTGSSSPTCPPPAIEAEQEAMRSLRCTSPRCPMFGQVFKTPKGFYTHLSEDHHRDGWSVKFDDGDLEHRLDRDELPGIELYAGGRKGMCINHKCPKFGTNFDAYSHLKQHARSFAHALTEEDLVSTENSDQEIWTKSDMPGMDVTEDEALWKCVRQGCKMVGRVMINSGNAKCHSYSKGHLMAAEEASSSSADESFEDMEGMAVSEEGVWSCVKASCKGFGKEFQHSGFGRQHGRCKMHVTAGETAVTPSRPTMGLFTTPKRATLNPLLTPVQVSGSTAHVSPGSPSAGRGSSFVKKPPPPPPPPATPTSASTPKTVKRRTPTTKAEMEKQYKEIEERVARLEEQMSQLLRPQSPQVPQTVPQTPIVQAARIESLSRFVRTQFRPILPMDES
ncbi:hypothetical protein F66182_9377 [Fusarium sp. NRRL 66182]|nr:hypothetical protein F66182_9377 [Fusarium sp. NRRL 66182]